jgi:hypothetical protein
LLAAETSRATETQAYTRRRSGQTPGQLEERHAEAS